MRKSTLIIEELKDIEKIISTANMLRNQIPDDYVVSSSLQDAEARQKMLISELKEAIAAERKHCVQYENTQVENREIECVVKGISLRHKKEVL